MSTVLAVDLSALPTVAQTAVIPPVPEEILRAIVHARRFLWCSDAPRHREESEHRSAVRQIPAFHTVATLCQLASVFAVGGHPSPVEVLRDATLAPLRSFQAQERPERGGKSKGRALRQARAKFEVDVFLLDSYSSGCKQRDRDE